MLVNIYNWLTLEDYEVVKARMANDMNCGVLDEDESRELSKAGDLATSRLKKLVKSALSRKIWLIL